MVAKNRVQFDMKKTHFLPGLVSIFVLTACSKDKAKSDALIEANKVHLESVAILESVENGLHTLNLALLEHA